MYKWIHRNQKKMLAVFGVLLMIVFIIPPSAKNSRSGGHDRVVGHVGKTAVYASESQRAREEWNLLSHRQAFNPNTGQPVRWVEQQLPPQALKEIDEHPELLMLLQKEAQQQGLQISDDRVNTMLKNQFGVTPDSSEDTERVREAVRDLLLVQSQYLRLANAIKVSTPVWQHALVGQQSVRLSFVEFPVSQFEKNVPAPTTQQIKEQFDKYANVPSDAGPFGFGQPNDPLGFGYQIPNRVKLQYVSVPHDEVVKAVRASRSDYQWQRDAAQEYLAHPEQYRQPETPATSPASGPSTTQATTEPTTRPVATTVPTTQPATQIAKAPTTGPTVRPFAEVREQIITKLMEPIVAERTQAIRSAIAARLTVDWQEYHRTHPATQASSRPATSQASSAPPTQPTSAPATNLSGYDSFAYLQAIASDIQKEFNVLPAVSDLQNEWLDAKALEKLPGMGQSHTEAGDQFPMYATTLFSTVAAIPTGQGLQPWEPSQPLTDTPGNTYLFRLTSAEPAHAPSDPATVGDTVARDYATAKAFEAARDAANKLLEASKKSGLASAAVNQSMALMGVGPFSPTQAVQQMSFSRFNPTGAENVIPGYPLRDPNAQRNFIIGSLDLLQKARPDAPHPTTLIELPQERKVLAVELAGVELMRPGYVEQMTISQQEKLRRLDRLAGDYFSYNAVAARLQYQPSESEKSGSSS